MNRIKIKPNSGIAIVYRPNTAPALDAANILVKWLNDKGYNVYTGPQQSKLKNTKMLKSFGDEESLKLIIVLGGDGTYLRAVRLLRGNLIPILGINLGSLGFLTPIRDEELFAMLEKTLQGKGTELCARSMLELTWNKGANETSTYLALNDVVVERGPSSHLIDLRLNMGKFLVSNIKSDALVLASPTGSTAYNLAGGGPIVHPDAKVIVVTPVAPHSLTSRPLIFPDSKTLEIKMQGQCKLAHIIVDGGKVGEFKPNQTLQIKRYKTYHWMIQPKGHNYYELLREKLRFGERN